ncbi:MAG: hypothetical protein ACMUIA_08835 [bacterium]
MLLCLKATEKVRGDSFVAKTNIHHPTDASLIIDGVRKMLDFVTKLTTLLSMVGWQWSGHLWAQVRRVHRRIQRTSASKKTDLEKRLQELYLELITSAQHIARRPSR